MANSVTTDIPATTYFSPQTVHLLLGTGVTGVSYTLNGIQPSISEYIAYDTLTPPNPFIAVTQDGKGRVVYDGGFPKFYNNVAPALGTPFSSLSGSFKYLYNAMKWVANPTKVAAGNNKILFLGDTLVGATFPIKGTVPTGFLTSLTNICSIAGFVPTFKDLSDYGGSVLNPSLAELENYCAVIMFSTAYVGGNPDLITQAAINDLMFFRENGNGLVFITDHGTTTITDISQVKQTPAGDGFYATANRVISNFGAFFAGNFDRTPVNVGFIRANYGDHPLYNGMTNAEDISAGASESKVVVTTFPVYDQTTVPPITMTADGRYTIRILAKKSDGSVETFKYVFAIINGGIVEIRNASSVPITQIDTGFSDRASLFPVILGSGLGTLFGQVTVDGVKVADMTFTEIGGSVVTWLDGNPAPHVNDDSVVRAEVTAPLSFFVEVDVTRFQPDISQMTSQARIQEVLRQFFSAPNIKTPIHQALDASGSAFKSDFGRGLAGLRVYLART